MTTEHIINCDADPYLPDGWKGVEEHQKGGSLIWDAYQFAPGGLSDWFAFIPDGAIRGFWVLPGGQQTVTVAGDKVYNAMILSADSSNVATVAFSYPYITNESN